MVEYFAKSLGRLKQCCDERGLEMTLQSVTVRTDYYPGVGGTHGSMPAIKPALIIEHEIQGKTGVIDIQAGAELLPSGEGVEEAARQYFEDHGFATVNTGFVPGVVPEEGMSNLNICYRSSDRKTACDFTIRPGGFDHPVQSAFYFFIDLGYEQALNRALDLLDGTRSPDELSVRD